MGTRLRSLLASGGVAVLAVASIPGIPLAAQAASAEPARASVTAPEDGEHDGMMRDGAHGDMMGSAPAMGTGHDGAGCENMMAAPGHDKHMAHMGGNGHDRMMRDGSQHSMS